MRTLLLDTSSENLLIGFHEEGKPLLEKSIPHHNKLSEILLPSILSLLETRHFLIQDIQRVAVGVGPGSYTGTRVGVCVAKALSFSRNIPLLSFCSLLCLIPDREGPFASVLPAKSGQFFILQGTKKGSFLLNLKTALLNQEAFEEVLSSLNFVTSLQPLPIPIWAPSKLSMQHPLTTLRDSPSTSCNLFYL